MKKILSVALLTAALLVSVAVLPEAANTADALDVYALFNLEQLKIYETDIAGHPVFSNIPKAKLQKMADELQIPVDKLQKVLVVQDALKTVGNDFTVKEIIEMPQKELFSNVAKFIEHVKKTKTPEELDAIMQKIKDAKTPAEAG